MQNKCKTLFANAFRLELPMKLVNRLQKAKKENGHDMTLGY
jgi:hypothetical protein